VKLGSVGTYSGIVGQNVAPGVKALQAWAAGVNSRGGLAGHRVDLVVADDGGDPARHVALVQQLVEKNGVVAFAYNAGVLSGQASVDYVTRKRVPVIGSEMASDWFYASPMFFPQGTSGRLIPEAAIGASADLLKPEGKSKIAVLTCSDGIQICKDGAEIGPKAAKDNGLQVVFQGQASLAQPDFTAECLNAQRAGADIIYIVMDANSANRIGRSCASVGYHPSLALNQQIVYNQQVTDPNLQGSTTSSLVAPWTATNIPGIAEFQQALTRFASGVEPSGSAMAGWVVGKMLERVAANGLPADVTSQTILDGLWSFKDETLGGVTSPLTFAKDQTAPRRVCYGRMIIKGGKLINPDNGKMTCR
jgi:branched-chain amino acid transport system substrate-binding protein